MIEAEYFIVFDGKQHIALGYKDYKEFVENEPNEKYHEVFRASNNLEYIMKELERFNAIDKLYI